MGVKARQPTARSAATPNSEWDSLLAFSGTGAHRFFESSGHADGTKGDGGAALVVAPPIGSTR